MHPAEAIEVGRREQTGLITKLVGPALSIIVDALTDQISTGKSTWRLESDGFSSVQDRRRELRFPGSILQSLLRMSSISAWSALAQALASPLSCGGGKLKWAGMPLRIQRFCHNCLMTQQAVSRQLCGACGGEFLPLLDENGAISSDFLVARASCCSNRCRNCPYERTESMSDQGTGCTIEKTCPRCTATFECRGAGCWCNNVRLGAAKLKWLERHYENCLCPACLASIESCCDLG